MKKMQFLFCLITAIILSTNTVFANTKLPILMYHDITNAQCSDNPWAVTHQSFFEDLVYLKQNQYTTLLPHEVVAIQNGNAPMPAKPIMITFDDGYQSNYQYALPVLEALDMSATVSVITSLMRFTEEDGNPDYLTWEEIGTMHNSGHFSIGSHTHNLHNSELAGGYNTNGTNGIGRIAGESQDAYRKRVGDDLQTSIQLIQTFTQEAPSYFAYPYGCLDSWFGEILKNNGIHMTTTVKFQVADIQNGLYALPRLTVTPQEPASYVLTNNKTKVVLPAKAITKDIRINQKNITMPAYLIADYAYINLLDLQAYCRNTIYDFEIQTDAQQNMRLIQKASVQQQPTNTSTLEHKDRVITAPPILLEINTGYAILFPIEGQYYIRLRDAKEMILDENPY